MTTSTKLPFLTGLLLCAGLSLGCVSAEDEANMTKKMDLENARAQVINDNLDNCAALGEGLSKWSEANGQALRDLDPWWTGLSTSAQDKLIAAHQSDWDKQTAALGMGGLSCNAEMIAGLQLE